MLGLDRTHHAVGVCLLSALMLTGCSGGGGGSAPSPDDGRAVAATFLDQIRAGQVDQAWAGTTPEFKSMLGLEGFRSYVRKNPESKAPAEFVACVPKPANGLDLAESSFRSTKSAKTLKVLLGKDAGTWKVERFAIE